MSPTPSHLIYSLMQRKQIESSDDEDYYCPESRGGKRLKIEEDESLKRIDSEENLDFQSEREELGSRDALVNYTKLQQIAYSRRAHS